MDKSQGYQLRIEDTELQAYLQRWPFAGGPDAEKNLIARKARWRLRQPGAEPERVYLAPDQASLSVEEQEKLKKIFQELQFSKSKQRTLMEDFGWEALLAPKTAKRVLVVGCGNGIELLFLRTVLPEAEFTAIDYHDNLTPPVKSFVNLKFLAGDFNQHLSSLKSGFDIISSNHTLEHLYMPDEMMKTFFDLLAPGGALISTLPLDGYRGSPFLDKVGRLVSSKDVHPIDLVFLDMGHAWKTNPRDLNQTLLQAGFSRVKIYQRIGHLGRYMTGGKFQVSAWRSLGLILNTLFFGVARGVIKLIFPKHPPNIVLKVLWACERRVWFGTNTLKNKYTEEAFIYATKGSAN